MTSIHGSYQVATTQLTIAIFFPGIYLGGGLKAWFKPENPQVLVGKKSSRHSFEAFL